MKKYKKLAEDSFFAELLGDRQLHIICVDCNSVKLEIFRQLFCDVGLTDFVKFVDDSVHLIELCKSILGDKDAP